MHDHPPIKQRVSVLFCSHLRASRSVECYMEARPWANQHGRRNIAVSHGLPSIVGCTSNVLLQWLGKRMKTGAQLQPLTSFLSFCGRPSGSTLAATFAASANATIKYKSIGIVLCIYDWPMVHASHRQCNYEGNCVCKGFSKTSVQTTGPGARPCKGGMSSSQKKSPCVTVRRSSCNLPQQASACKTPDQLRTSETKR